MTMALDSNPQRFGSLHYVHMSYSSHHPQFTNPWGAPTSSVQSSLYSGSTHTGLSPNPLSLDSLTKQSQHQPHPHQHHPHHHQPPVPHPISRGSSSSVTSLASYGSVPVSASSGGSPHNLLSLNRLAPVNSLPTTTGYSETPYTTAAAPIHPAYVATSQAPYDSLGRYAATPLQHNGMTIPAEANHGRRTLHDERSRFADALEASQGMLSMSQDTPRNIYGPNASTRARGSTDAYGFPSTNSTSSSVSSTSGYAYYGGSIDSSDYSTAGSDVESLASRTLPRPQGLMSSHAPPAPSSMMGQFSSKVSNSSQKKHKCKVCDKRFTRPSSLQTHMYSHTGEKPFQCEVEGCGRHFSVVSNLRRHRKVHKGDARSEAGSEDHHSD